MSRHPLNPCDLMAQAAFDQETALLAETIVEMTESGTRPITQLCDEIKCSMHAAIERVNMQIKAEDSERMCRTGKLDAQVIDLFIVRLASVGLHVVCEQVRSHPKINKPKNGGGE